jgi:hypothetical protein
LLAFFDRPLMILALIEKLFMFVFFFLFTLIIGAILRRFQNNCVLLMGRIMGCVTGVG